MKLVVSRFVTTSQKLKKPRQMLEVPSGHGKSYIANYVFAVLANLGHVDEVHLVYSEPEIRELERPNLELIGKIFRSDRIHAHLHSDLRTIHLEKRALWIVDECDVLFLRVGPAGTFNITGPGLLLGLSATGVYNASKLERQYCARTHKLWAVSTHWNEIKEQAKRVKPLESVGAFFDQARKAGKVVFAAADEADAIKECAA